MKTAQNILVYDGLCNLCNFLVRLVLKHDKEGNIKFISFQSKNIAEYIPQKYQTQTTVVFTSNSKYYIESSAVLQLFKVLGKWWKFMLIFYVFPPFLRDFIYRIVAKNRYRLFGKSKECQLVGKEYLNRFLD